MALKTFEITTNASPGDGMCESREGWQVKDVVRLKLAHLDVWKLACTSVLA